MNRLLMKFIALPPGVKMVLAAMGFGSIASILFFLLPALKNPKAKLWLIVILVIAGAIFGIFWLIRWMFGRKKSSKLEGALESQGPTRGDIAEQEQIYREKFRAKLAELKGNGLSVYKLPWFVLMGEPGCGKTATLINSGLDFPLGKDEVPGFGGTRNYNWWFTNNAVILDTAGRIAFQEEGTTDKVEWEYFIKLLKSNRPRCPINGIIVAIPADKLLRDSADERAAKATVLRERLRQVHQLLGVRFPTFIIVTKMDLVGGFNEFFDEIRPDLTQRNQMFGWSRPDEFQATYDPSAFTETFDSVYVRLRDWSMRYLQRTHATEDELGMVVTFPESFRQLRQALTDYVGTIFQKSPLLEPPFFRGFYFTSSVQEGAPLMDIFAKTRAGGVVQASRTRPVDSKAFFIHDFYEHKVFPEQGLVFRSAKHVTLNKRMRRIVWAGTSVMALIMLSFFLFGVFGIRKLVTNPQNDCDLARKQIDEAAKQDAVWAKIPENVQLAQRMAGHVEQFGGFWNATRARLLFIGANLSQPRAWVRDIHAKHVLVTLVEPTLNEFAKRVRESTLPEKGATPEQRKAYLAALSQYAQWYGEAVGQATWGTEMSGDDARIRARQFAAILAALPLGTADQSAVVGQVERALVSLSLDKRVFARDILKAHAEVVVDPQVLLIAVNEIKGRWEGLTRIDASNTRREVQYWVKFAAVMQNARVAYDRVLALREPLTTDFKVNAAEFLRQTEGVENLATLDTPPLADTFVGAWHAVARFMKDEAPNIPHEKGYILRIRDLFGQFEGIWNAEFKVVEDALAIGAPRSGTTSAEQVYKAIGDARQSLKTSFDNSIADLRKSLGIESDREPLDYYLEQKLLTVNESDKDLTKPIAQPTIEIASTAFGADRWLVSLLVELRKLASAQDTQTKLGNLAEWPGLIASIRSANPLESGYRYVGSWLAGVPADLDGARRNESIQKGSKFSAEQTVWKSPALYDTASAVWVGWRSDEVGRVLGGIAERCRATLGNQPDGMPGLARLRDKYDDRDVRELPFTVHAYNQGGAEPPPQPAQAQPQPTQEPPAGQRGRPITAQPPPDQGQPGRAPRGDVVGTKLLARYHTRDFMFDTLRDYVKVSKALTGMPGADPASAALRQAADAYVDSYFETWYGVYNNYTRLLDQPTLDLLKKCREGTIDWPTFQRTMAESGDELGREMALRLAAVIREAVYFGAKLKPGDADEDAAAALVNARLDALFKKQLSLPDALTDLTRFVAPPGSRSPEDALVDKVTVAWSAYAGQIRKLGPLDEKAPHPGGPKADLDGLKTSIVDERYLKKASPAIVPLLELADYGQRLLANDLENKAAAIFAPVNNKYPVVTPAAIRDTSETLTRLREAPTLTPDQFVALLGAAAEFEKTYGELYRSVVSAPRGDQALKLCKEWQTFLAGEGGAVGPRSRGVGVHCTFDPQNRPPGTVNPGAICEEVCVTLPLITLDAPAGEICVPTRGSAADEEAPKEYKYFWQLVGDRTFAATTSVIRQVSQNGQSNGYQNGAKAWELPASPWSLPMLLGSHGESFTDGRWRIPVVIRGTAKEPLGIFIRVQFERTFPGLIPPLDPPGPAGKMEAADKFFVQN